MKIEFSVTWTPVLAAALFVWKCSYWIMRYETLQQGFYLFSDRCKESSTTPTNYCLGLRYYVGVCKYAKEEVRKINVWKMKIMCNYPWDGVGFWGIEMSPRDPLDWADPWDGVDCWGIEISPRRDPWDGVALGDPWDRVVFVGKVGSEKNSADPLEKRKRFKWMKGPWTENNDTNNKIQASNQTDRERTSWKKPENLCLDWSTFSDFHRSEMEREKINGCAWSCWAFCSYSLTFQRGLALIQLCRQVERKRPRIEEFRQQQQRQRCIRQEK